MLLYPDGNLFAVGRIPCEICPIPGDRSDTKRLLIPVQVGGITTTAVVDTGGIYLILAPDIAIELHLNPDGAIGQDSVKIRGWEYSGNLYRVYLDIPAEEGESLQQDVATLVPNATAEEWGELPTYLGLTGCLEYLRFAVDPIACQFYFASA